MTMLTQDSLHSRTLTVLRDEMEAGLHIGAQLMAMIGGRLVAEVALGDARLAADGGETAISMRSDTLMLWLSAGKPVTAIAIAMLVERGALSLDQSVASVIPEFATNGKDVITLRHLLTHTAGIRGVDSGYPFGTWEETIARICAMRVERDWVPGERAGYHTHTTWYLLGELIERVTGERHDMWIRANLLEPAGMSDTWLAMSAERYQAYGSRMGYLYDTSERNAPPKPGRNIDTELAVSRPRPSASCRGPMRDLARFYEMLRLGGTVDGVRLLREETVHAFTSRQRVGMPDATFRQTIDWGLGFILNSSQYGPAIPYQFGPYASPETFGHGGSQSSTGFCDPVRQLVVALVFNGTPGEAAHDRRLRATLKALYEDLELTSSSAAGNKAED
jgi:CubicO group peptidase (beta-lactamase class C family)